MSLGAKIRGKLYRLYRRMVLRDPIERASYQWVRCRGDQTYRLDYPLGPDNVVIDIGGYLGDFAADLFQRHGCRIFLFEPVEAYYNRCTERFAGNPAIQCFNYGLSTRDETIEMSVDGLKSSFERTFESAEKLQARVRDANAVFSELGLQHIDLMKINIEGGEYELLPYLGDTGWIARTRHLQIQFHNFIADAVAKRNKIRDHLDRSHRESWNFEFIWESWSRRQL